ncbi:MAG: tryptophan--tRNA ligase [Anaerolineae bacterium]|nr:tryptophan--tRNA ligase [Anaerolineae bacterium]
MTNPKRVFSGVQPSGNLTIGNYIGAIRQWVERQQEFDACYCVVDAHAITVPYEPQTLQTKTREVAALYLAAGLSTDYATVFVQSHVPQHTELAWYLTCITSLGWLNRMTQFKDKSARLETEMIGAGLLNYPVLMAADILLYQTELVPVGDDQRQHIELARDIAQRFNATFGETFTIPAAMIPLEGARVMGLDTPTTKMSKSTTDSQYHAVYLLDEPDTVLKKFKRAVTDSLADIRFSADPERAGVNNLLTIFQALTHQNAEGVEAHFAGKGYGHLKTEVAEVVIETLRPIQQHYAELMAEGGYIDRVLAEGAAKAQVIATQTVADVKGRMGFLLPAL